MWSSKPAAEGDFPLTVWSKPIDPKIAYIPVA
jgi:hypothetical protein